MKGQGPGERHTDDALGTEWHRQGYLGRERQRERVAGAAGVKEQQRQCTIRGGGWRLAWAMEVSSRKVASG